MTRITDLESIFYSDEHLMKNSRALYERATDAGLPYTRREVEAWYKNQAVQQVFRPMGKLNFAPVQRYGIGDRVYGDTMFMGNFAIVCFIDTFSKYAYAKAFKDSVTAKKALETFKEFEALLGHPVQECRVDVGSEFKAEFEEYLDKKKTKTLPYTKNEAGIIERYNGTLRLSLEKLKAVRGTPINWIYKYLPLALDSYNSTRHKTTGQKPNDILHDQDARDKAIKKLKERMAKVVPKETLKVGDKVRKWIRDLMNPFDRKRGANWSWDLYAVKKVDRDNNRVLLEDDTWWKPYYLQKVDVENLMEGSPKIREALEESMEKEQEAREPPRASALQRKATKELGDYLSAPEGKPWAKEGKRERRANPKYVWS